MRRRLILWGFAWWLSGCAEYPTPTEIYGEVHVHGFAGGSHPGALFLAAATPKARVEGDSILPATPPAAIEGSCTLTTTSVCADCTPPLPVDGGAVHIAGGRGIPDVELAFQPAQRSYLPTTALPGAIFTGGELLTITGDGAVAASFAASILAPAPLLLTKPAAPAIGSDDLVVAWLRGNASRVHVTLVVSTSDGRWAIIDCLAGDDAGQVTVPSSLIAALPPAPRDVQLIASRDQLLLAPSAKAGFGVVLHAGFETRIDWHERY